MVLSESDRHRVQAAVAAAEQRAGAHIATAVVPAADRYALYPLLWAALLSLLVGGVIALVRQTMTVREFFAIEAVVFVAASLILDWWPVRLRIVPSHIRRAHAAQFARREFAARVLSAGDKGGVLLFVAFGERYAEVIGDRALHRQIGEQGWNRIMAALVSAAKSGRLADGLIAAIDLCADEIVASRQVAG